MSNYKVRFSNTPSGVPLLFVSRPTTSPDTCLAVLSTERYVSQNTSGIFEYSYNPVNKTVVSAVSTLSFLGTTLNGTTVGAFSASQAPLTIENGSVKFNWLNSPITIRKVVKKENGSFFPIIRSGTVWRFYRVSDQEPEWSWLKKAGLGVGDEVFLGYSVPEAMYGTTSLVNPVNIHECRLLEVTEHSNPTSKNVISFEGDLVKLKEIYVNDILVTSTAIIPGEESNYVKSIDLTSKRITLKTSLDPEARVRIVFYEYAQNYEYKGFRFVDENNVSS